jgi:dTDP-4-amino-4,6-dideoxygalactose transaminase
MIPHSRPALDARDIEAVSKVLRSGSIAQGAMVKRFEETLSRYVGMNGGVAVNSGTAALFLSIRALNITVGDEVILPTYVCTAPLHAILRAGATARLCDIERSGYNISADEVRRKITRRTKAVIVPHLFGISADIDRLLGLGIPVIEDCAHSIGATFRGRMTGSFGALSVFSFYATKVIACGEGGMVCSRSKRLLEKIRDMREYDKKDTYAPRFNYKMSDIHAALGLSQLSKLASFIAARRRLARAFNRWFSQCDIEVPHLDEGSILYRYVVKIHQNPGRAIRDLEKRGIECRRPVYRPLHRYLGLKGFPNAEKAWNTALSIPLYPSLTRTEAKKVRKAIVGYFGEPSHAGIGHI